MPYTKSEGPDQTAQPDQDIPCSSIDSIVAVLFVTWQQKS